MEGFSEANYLRQPNHRWGTPVAKAFSIIQESAFLPAIATVSQRSRLSVLYILKQLLRVFLDFTQLGPYHPTGPVISLHSESLLGARSSRTASWIHGQQVGRFTPDIQYVMPGAIAEESICSIVDNPVTGRTGPAIESMSRCSEERHCRDDASAAGITEFQSGNVVQPSQPPPPGLRDHHEMDRLSSTLSFDDCVTSDRSSHPPSRKSESSHSFRRRRSRKATVRKVRSSAKGTWPLRIPDVAGPECVFPAVTGTEGGTTSNLARICQGSWTQTLTEEDQGLSTPPEGRPVSGCKSLSKLGHAENGSAMEESSPGALASLQARDPDPLKSASGCSWAATSISLRSEISTTGLSSASPQFTKRFRAHQRYDALQESRLTSPGTWSASFGASGSWRCHARPDSRSTPKSPSPPLEQRSSDHATTEGMLAGQYPGGLPRTELHGQLSGTQGRFIAPQPVNVRKESMYPRDVKHVMACLCTVRIHFAMLVSPCAAGGVRYHGGPHSVGSLMAGASAPRTVAAPAFSFVAAQAPVRGFQLDISMSNGKPESFLRNESHFPPGFPAGLRGCANQQALASFWGVGQRPTLERLESQKGSGACNEWAEARPQQLPIVVRAVQFSFGSRVLQPDRPHLVSSKIGTPAPSNTSLGGQPCKTLRCPLRRRSIESSA
ncbi:hypothetical protein Purlil1_14177 [Purpureocillium lilacinum]|uniref:Uncharacterized protein n=1 Tax=Purpureocillium lilacinum TaxID=33203 RepID=A0ABR0BC09_PURLI|nr:hypothetical protein Purlil1_14177 [Purpureocillium lilacinum]